MHDTTHQSTVARSGARGEAVALQPHPEGAADPDDPGPRRHSSERSAAVDVHLEIHDDTGALSQRQLDWLTSSGAAALRLAVRGGTGFDPGAAHEVRAAIVNDARMAELHERHSGIPGTTDVLTFDLRAPGAEALDVDVAICIDEARRQAAVQGHAPERELLLYILHGALHCLGHDDHDESAAAAMHAREDEILAAIGVGATYVPDAAGVSELRR